jgi:hypothetical protein
MKRQDHSVIIGYAPTPSCDEVCDFSFGLPATRLMHSA